MTPLYRESFAILCRSWQFICEVENRCLAAAKADPDWMVQETDAGTFIQHPLVGIRNTAWANFSRLAAKFGLSPADINAVRVAETPAQKDPKAEFFEARGA